MFAVTAWKSGPHGRDTMYGLRVSAADRARYFRRDWRTVELHLPRHGRIVVGLSPSFWRSCPELRSEQIGAWLRATAAAPWRQGRPPRYMLRPTADAVFRIEPA